MLGYQILAKALAAQQVEHVYGIVGIPVIELGYAMQAEGLKYYGFRNEQQASYSAGYTGYLTNKPGACLCVSGPGHTNAISGVMNAWANCWPMLLISGSNDLQQDSRQAFQECDQVYFVKPYAKYAVRIVNARDIPFHVQKAVSLSTYGRPGPVYLDLPGDVLNQTVQEPLQFPLYKEPPRSQPRPSDLDEAIKNIFGAARPLIIVGKGAAYGKASQQCRKLVELSGLPFLPTPMGKGVVSDEHPLNVSAARSQALKNADLIILLGARLNWILHFGLSPRFFKGVKVIQCDIFAQEMDHNVLSAVRLLGDLRQTLTGLCSRLKQHKPNCQPWIKQLKAKSSKNVEMNKTLMASNQVPMSYYSAYEVIQRYIPSTAILVGEGANTMDIGRTVFLQKEPRTKLDAGTFGTMGIGLPALISARTTNPNRWAVAVMGDSAFGFSGFETETITRYGLGSTIFIINNNGIYAGTDALEGDPSTYPVTSLNPAAKYELLATAFGGKGYEVKNKSELQAACKEIFANPSNISKLYIVNVRIASSSQKKPQENAWLTRGEAKL